MYFTGYDVVDWMGRGQSMVGARMQMDPAQWMPVSTVVARGQDAFDLIAGEQHDQRFTICFDARRLDSPEIFRRSGLIDLSAAFSGTLMQVVNDVLDEDGVSLLFDMDSRMEACRKAAAATSVDTDDPRIAPEGFVAKFVVKRCEMIAALYKNMDEYRGSVLLRSQSFNALRRIEHNRIAIDVGRLSELLSSEREPHEHSFLLKTAESLGDDGFIRPRFNVHATRTGRVHAERGTWNFVGIPKSDVREVIVSKHEWGKIVSVDANASDYRCIVAMCGDEKLKERYKAAADFHDRTATMVGARGPQARNVAKALTYVVVYGGSDDAIVAALGDEFCSANEAAIKRMAGSVKKLFAPIAAFRDGLAREAAGGYVTTPRGRRVYVGATEHPGQILALWAQATSADVNMSLVARLEREHDVLFVVHDEVVLDVPGHRITDDELCEISDSAAWAFHDVIGMLGNCRVRTGKSYWEATR